MALYYKTCACGTSHNEVHCPNCSVKGVQEVIDGYEASIRRHEEEITKEKNWIKYYKKKLKKLEAKDGKA